MRGSAAALLVLWPVCSLAAQTGGDAVVQGRKALDLLLAGRYSEFRVTLTANAREKFTPEFMRDTVGPEVKGFGNLEQVGQPVTQKVGAENLVSFPVRFSRVLVNVQFALNDLGHVAGLFFRPADEPLPASWKRPSYSKPERFSERAANLGVDPWKLGATLTVPAGRGPFPAIVLVHGPGPNDRNEAIFATRMFEDLAEGLASRGVVVIRYDKRTKAYGEKMSVLPFTIRQETVEDALRAISFVRAQPEVDPRRVYALGHSLGGYIMPRIAQEDGRLAGAIFAEGNARRIEDVSLAQTAFLLEAKGGATSDERRRFELMQGEAERVRTLQPRKDNPPILLGLPVEYFLDLKAYDPVAEAKRAGLPMLFLQGERDFQVTLEDFRLWKTGLAGARAEFHTYPALNHLLIAGEGAPSPAEYRKPGNVAPEVVEDIASWLAAQKRQ